jgi:hypothetical protein
VKEMKETKKMMGVIEAQYRKANEEYRKGLKRKQKMESIKTNVMCASLFLNLLIVLSILASFYW